MKRTVPVDVTFVGNGTVGPDPDTGGGVRGGVVAPEVHGHVALFVYPTKRDESGLWSPIVGEGSLKGGLQISICADSDGFRELGRCLIGLAELDASFDPGWHAHHDELMSRDGKTRVDLIVRKMPPDVLQRLH